MAVKHLSQYNDDGVTVGQDASDKCGFHGEAVVQASAIGTVGSSGTSLKTVVNSVLAALRGKGIIASS